MFHGGLWGGWQYSVASQQPNASTLRFGFGGHQEARGSSVTKNHFFIEGVLEELDAPGEWFLDPKPDPPVLYYWPNRTTNGDLAPPDKVVLPLLESIVVVNGSKNVSFTGFEFTETRATYMEMYEVPSGGDWSVYGGFSLKIGALVSHAFSARRDRPLGIWAWCSLISARLPRGKIALCQDPVSLDERALH